MKVYSKKMFQNENVHRFLRLSALSELVSISRHFGSYKRGKLRGTGHKDRNSQLSWTGQ